MLVLLAVLVLLILLVLLVLLILQVLLVVLVLPMQSPPRHMPPPGNHAPVCTAHRLMCHYPRVLAACRTAHRLLCCMGRVGGVGWRTDTSHGWPPLMCTGGADPGCVSAPLRDEGVVVEIEAEIEGGKVVVFALLHRHDVP